MQFTSQIAGAPGVIFDLIADMPNYGRWLPDTDVFGGTVNVTPYPVRLGTTYLDAGPVEKPGKVTEFDPPKHIGFHHTILVRKALLKTDITHASLHVDTERRRDICSSRTRSPYEFTDTLQVGLAPHPGVIPQGECANPGLPQAVCREINRHISHR